MAHALLLLYSSSPSPVAGLAVEALVVLRAIGRIQQLVAHGFKSI